MRGLWPSQAISLHWWVTLRAGPQLVYQHSVPQMQIAQARKKPACGLETSHPIQPGPSSLAESSTSDCPLLSSCAGALLPWKSHCTASEMDPKAWGHLGQWALKICLFCILMSEDPDKCSVVKKVQSAAPIWRPQARTRACRTEAMLGGSGCRQAYPQQVFAQVRDASIFSW